MANWERTEDMENKTGTYASDPSISPGRLGAEYGLCAKCNKIKVLRTKLDDCLIWCGAFSLKDEWAPRLRPNRSNPITECSEYYPKGQVDLMEMQRIAWIIDVNRNPIDLQGKLK